MKSVVSDQQTALVRYLRMLAGPRPQSRLIEVRYLDEQAPTGMARRFVKATDLSGAMNVISRLAGHTDVYTGVLLRTRRAGGKDAVGASHLLWVEVDREDAVDRLAGLQAPPTMVIASGSKGHAHGYWVLRGSVQPNLVSAYNRHLALVVGGDLQSIDAARILRPPATLNHKYSPPTAVELVDVDPTRRYEVGELLDAFPRQEPIRPRRAPSIPASDRRGLDKRLLSIPAAEYVQRLTGQEPDRSGKVSCPFHEDWNPSLQLYPDGTFYCFQCGAGGSLYDFAAKLWGLSTKDRDFIELRRRLAERLVP